MSKPRFRIRFATPEGRPTAPGFYVIDERVTEAGHYITWDGIFETIKSARLAIQRRMKCKLEEVL